jgi:hyperosmotically inducible protein
MSRWLARAVALPTLAVAAAVTASAQSPSTPAPTDIQIRDAITRRLLERVLPDAGAIYVAVKDGAVTLRGTVVNSWTKAAAFEEALAITGVKQVSSEIAVARGVPDAAIARQIDEQLFRYVFYTIFDIVHPSVKNGVVTLEGVVTEGFKAVEIEGHVARVRGVLEVRNLIRTIEASTTDETLRRAIATRLYRLPGFWPYSVLISPPIHVVVEQGRVTLYGDVDTATDRDRATALVSVTPGVKVFDNLIRVRKP